MQHEKYDKIDQIGQLLVICAQLCKREVDQKFQRYALTRAQTYVMIYLMESGDREINQRDLEHLLQIRAPTVNGIVDRLEDKGFLIRKTGKRDGRCRRLIVTEKGRQLEQELSRDLSEMQTMITKGFTQEEQEQLRSYLLRIIENVKGETTDL